MPSVDIVYIVQRSVTKTEFRNRLRNCKYEGRNYEYEIIKQKSIFKLYAGMVSVNRFWNKGGCGRELPDYGG